MAIPIAIGIIASATNPVVQADRVDRRHRSGRVADIRGREDERPDRDDPDEDEPLELFPLDPLGTAVANDERPG